ncbi:hypothetical protein ACS0TY_023092 [Phlomoides rotata]
MGPTRKSKSGSRRYINEVSPPRDADSAKGHNSKKRKFSDMLGPRWTVEELSRFYEAYRKYSTDWRKVAVAVRNRSPEMVEALFKLNRAYLSLPHGTASAAGLIAMVTDHYFNLVGSDKDQESNDGAGSSRKTQKRARGKVQPTTSKASDDHCVSHSQTIASNNGCLPLLKKTLAGGSRPRPVGKRTPRFPVSYFYENSNGEKNASPTRHGLKLNANTNDDEVVHEIAFALAEVSQRGGSPQFLRTPSKRAENVMSSPCSDVQRKHSLPELPSTQILAADMNGRVLEGSTGSDTGELSRYRPSKMESTSVGTVKEATMKLSGNKYDFEQNNHLDDTEEEFSEEGQTFGRTRGKLDVAVTNGKVSSFSMHRQREKSKKKLFENDEAQAFAALHTLADLSLMMSTKDEDDTKVQFQDDNDDHANRLVSAESLPINQQKGKHKHSGVRKKGYKSRSSLEVPSCRTSKPGTASAIVVSSAPEKNQDLQLSITEKPRKKLKMQVPKIQKTTPDLDNRCSGSPRVEDGDPAKKLMNKRKKSSESGSLNLLRNSENSSSTDLQKKGSESGQLAEEILVVNQLYLPTKVRSKRKIEPRKLQVQKDMKFPDKISNDRLDLPLALLQDGALNLKENLSICLSNPRLRRWCTYEWFYSAIDYPWFAKQEFVEYLKHVGLGHVPRLTRVEWGVIRSSLGKPRRFSEQFLMEEKEKLNQYRDSVRKQYTELRKVGRGGWPPDLPRPLSVGQCVVAIHPKTREIHDGRVLTVEHSRCQVQFDHHELGVEYVMDIDCMPSNHFENMPALLGKQTISVNKCVENFDGRVQERVKLLSGDYANEIYAISQLSPSANPTSLLKQTKVSSVNTDPQMGIGLAETATYQQAAYPQPTTLDQIQAKEADVQALAALTRALEKKEAIVVELRRMNDDAFGNQKKGHSSLKDSEPFKKQYAAVLIQLSEANEQVESALHCLRQRNTYQGNIALGWSRSGTSFADRGGVFSSARSASQTCESGTHVNEIVDSSRVEARAMVDAAMQAMSSLKSQEHTIGKFEESVDYANDRLPSDDSSVPAVISFPLNYLAHGSPLCQNPLIL